MGAQSQGNRYVVPPRETHTHTVIFLHGRESTASEFAAELLESQASDSRVLLEIFPTIKWVFPNSGTRTSARYNIKELQWFDMWDVKNPQERKDLQMDGLRESIAFILDLVRTETAFVPPERIILGGISQGCATAIHALLYGGIRLGGFIGLSSWLPFQNDITEKAQYCASDSKLLQRIRGLFKTSSTKAIIPQSLRESFPDSELAFKTPVFLSYSKDDEVVPFVNGDMFCWGLEEDLGFDVDCNVYEHGGHWINEPQGVDDMIAFLGRVIKA
jgi:predicted esterase